MPVQWGFRYETGGRGRGGSVCCSWNKLGSVPSRQTRAAAAESRGKECSENRATTMAKEEGAAQAK